jgi:hypothetical protein
MAKITQSPDAKSTQATSGQLVSTLHMSSSEYFITSSSLLLFYVDSVNIHPSIHPSARPSVRPSVGSIFWPYLLCFDIINPSFKAYAGFLPQFRDTKKNSNFFQKVTKFRKKTHHFPTNPPIIFLSKKMNILKK